MKLSIVIPAYNEEKRIRPTLGEYHDFFYKKYKNNFEILIILNGCNDNTLKVVRDFSKGRKQIKYVDIKEAIGKGGAIMHGFNLARGDFIGFVDADNATKPNAFYDLIKKIKNNDGIVASRWIKGARINKKQPFLRRLASRTFNLIVVLFFGIKIRDTQCGAKLFTKKAVASVVNDIGITKWAFDIDLLYHLRKKGFKVIEIPTEWHDQDESKLSVRKASIQMFLAVIRLRLIYSPFNFVVEAYNKICDGLFK